MSKIKFVNKYDDIISVDNLLLAWREFLIGKKSRKDVQEFQRYLMFNIFSLHHDLKLRKYKHSEYQAFNISDPKPRVIHKASVRDRLLHHAIYRLLYPFFNKIFIADSFSCRLTKGTHKAIKRFTRFYLKVSKNKTKQTWVLKCDVRKFFDSIDQNILLKFLTLYIEDKEIVELLAVIITSFHKNETSKGLPLGNLTSQLFVNIYMNMFDQYVKHKLKAKYYIRYADDFVILSDNKEWLEDILLKINDFLTIELKLVLHPDKVSIHTFSSGIDFLGWINFSDHKILRTKTKKRMFKRLAESQKEEVVGSYLGMLRHGNTLKLVDQVGHLINK